MEKFLVNLKDKNREDTKKDIVANYTKATLLDFRRKLFETAVKKAEESLEDNNIPWDELSDTGRTLEQKPSSWGLRNRKTKPSVADDTIDLALFSKGSTAKFPIQIVRGLPEAEKAGKTPQNTDLEKESTRSESECSVFDETIDVQEKNDACVDKCVSVLIQK